MKKAINGWAFGDMPLERAFALAADAGYEGFELVFGENGSVSPQATATDADAVKALADRHGLQLASVACGLFWNVSPTASDSATRARAVELGQALIRYARMVDVDAVLIVPGAVGIPWMPEAELIPYDIAEQRAREFIGALVPAAEAAQVKLGVENVWNKLLLTPTEFRAFIDGFNSPWVAAYVDVANMLFYGYPEHWIRILGSRVTRVHFKDYAAPAGAISPSGFLDLLEGDVNWPAVTAALREIGYNGWVTAEIGPYRHHPTARLYVTSMAMDFILGRR